MKTWIDYYRYVIDIYAAGQNLFLVHYEDLALRPNLLRDSLGTVIGKKLQGESLPSFVPNRHPSAAPPEVDKHLLQTAYELYRLLLSHKIPVEE